MVWARDGGHLHMSLNERGGNCGTFVTVSSFRRKVFFKEKLNISNIIMFWNVFTLCSEI